MKFGGLFRGAVVLGMGKVVAAIDLDITSDCEFLERENELEWGLMGKQHRLKARRVRLRME